MASAEGEKVIDTYHKYEPGNIKSILSATEPRDIPELIRAVMVLCDVIERQERRIGELEDAEQERSAAEGLSESVALYNASPSA